MGIDDMERDQIIEKILPPENAYLKAITEDSENFIPEEEKELIYHSINDTTIIVNRTI